LQDAIAIVWNHSPVATAIALTLGFERIVQGSPTLCLLDCGPVKSFFFN
jgi:hypothetical protein